MAEKKPKSSTKKAASKKKTAKRTSRKKAVASQSHWTFPKNTLEDAIKVARALEDKYAGNPTKSEDLVKAVGFKKTNDWRYLDLLTIRVH